MEDNKFNNSEVDVKDLKAQYKAALKQLSSEHDVALKEMKVKQAQELVDYKKNQIEQKALAKQTKAEVKTEYADFKAKQAQELEEFTSTNSAQIEEFKAEHSNLVDQYNFTCQKNQELEDFKQKQREEFMFFDSKEKNKVNKVNLNWKNEVIKFRIDQFEQYHTVEEKLRYEEYLLEQEQKAEIDSLTQKEVKGDSETALVDADKEQGNAFVLFFKHLWRDLKLTISDKPSIIFGLLVMVTGVVFGFTIDKYVKIAKNFEEQYAIVGVFIFVFEMAGMLNLVNGFGMCSSRRLKSVVLSTIATAIIVVTGILWMYFVANKMLGTTSSSSDIRTANIILIICMLTSVVGSVGGYFTYDKEALQAKR